MLHELDERFVLDHGHVRLVDMMGDDLAIVRSARVSYNAEWRTGEDEGKDEKLINYLVKNKHTSPLECVQFTFDIKCPMFVARQWMRHRTWSYNEVSARYTELPEEYYLPDTSLIGVQSKSNKQMREIWDNDPFSLAKNKEMVTAMDDHCKNAFKLYKDLLEKGMPRELARGVLPMNTYTHFFATVDLHNLMHFLKLRLHEHAQYEIRVYAEAMAGIIRQYVPVTMRAFEEHILGR